jgi:hypothetical protein
MQGTAHSDVCKSVCQHTDHTYDRKIIIIHKLIQWLVLPPVSTTSVSSHTQVQVQLPYTPYMQGGHNLRCRAAKEKLVITVRGFTPKKVHLHHKDKTPLPWQRCKMAQMLCKPHSTTTEASHSIAPAPSCYFLQSCCCYCC